MDASPSTSDTSYMSIDLDSSILHQVQKAIHRFAAATQQESEDDEEIPIPQSLKPAALPLPIPELTLEEKRCEYEYQVRSLEAEIRLLEDELKRRDQPLPDITDKQLEQAVFSVDHPSCAGAMDQSPSMGADSSTTMSVDDQELRGLRSQVRLSEAFSGIRFTNTSWEITHKDDRGLFRKHSHSGTAHGFSFQVQFIVREEKVFNSEGEPIDQAKIIALRPQVDPQLQSEMRVFLKRVSTDCDLMNFYQTYSKCCVHVLERQSTLKAIKSSHSKVVLSSGVSVTRMQVTFDNGCRLFLTWDVGVSELGQVDHSISLQTKASATASEEQREGLRLLPRLLQRILSAHGQSKGIVKFLSILLDPTSHLDSAT